MGGHSWAELPGAGEQGDKGSLRGMRGGERFYSQGGRPSQVFPYKEESTGYSCGWCPRAPCRYLIGPGCRRSVPGSLASLWNLSVAFFWGIPQHAQPFTSDFSTHSKRPLYQNQTKILQENYRPISFVSYRHKTFNKILGNQIQRHILKN